MKSDLLALQDFTLPRCIVPSSKIVDLQFHLFTNASESAYSAVVYSRIVDENGFISMNLVAGKARVTPTKTISLPRLELCGAHLRTKLLTKVLAVMKTSKFQKIEWFGWTVATIVLQWLARLPRTMTLFVADRVSEIQQTLPISQWNHVRSTLNPANLSSRGARFTDLKVPALWWNGPDWLAMPSDTWQKTPLVVYSSIRHKITEEERNRKQREDNQPETVTTSLSTTGTPPIVDENVYSILHKLFRMIATVKISISRFKKGKIPSEITSQLLQQAKLHFLISHQTTHFHEEYSLLQAQKRIAQNMQTTQSLSILRHKQTPLESEDDFRKVIFLKRRKFHF